MDRLKQRADFVAAANGLRMSAPAFVLQSRGREDKGPVRFGFTVSKKVGNAPERNRVRRRLRELVKRLDVTSVRPHHDYVIIGRRAALDRGFETMFNDLRSALTRLERPSKPSTKPSNTEISTHAPHGKSETARPD
jgi:ribonuclease P protein component